LELDESKAKLEDRADVQDVGTIIPKLQLLAGLAVAEVSDEHQQHQQDKQRKIGKKNCGSRQGTLTAIKSVN
jgi:hypothetical protein